ncbi:hypothetical protein E0V23_22940, partial [Salmonella enterica subsp. enterica serovar Nottingham]|nr:hypothetical protein [Salmonella enterica subsp. enterica]EBN8681290.1 hypothetical protein [Salmonella enterica]EBQ9065719.1 hypothetical protein [Salmonella enterica subsp. enterica serovar Oranienburg]EBW4238493.1 hypothetical protein [Salmonella enterica subsp. enterica serovar Javiana]ECD3996502.1 hypothetical protein [Salmonella enterica subsp. enterica serovar Nottingham]
GGQDARHKLPGINLVKKPILTDGLFCVCGNCKNVGLISAAPSGNLHRRMAASPYPAYGIDIMPVYTALFRRHNHKPSQHRYGKLLPIEYQESSHDPLPKTLEYLRH